jgi:hypothetical protein
VQFCTTIVGVSPMFKLYRYASIFDGGTHWAILGVIAVQLRPVLVHVVGPAVGAFYFAQKMPKDHF